MSRLIRDTDLKELYENCEGLKVPCEVVLQNIDDQPTAFALEAVVRELEEAREPHKQMVEQGCQGFVASFANALMGAYNEAIEIVKRGGQAGDGE